MAKTRVIIVGGGISGLSLAWYLTKNPEIEVTLLEKEGRVGGWMGTDATSGFLFEKAPRIFKTSRSLELLQLIEELGLNDKLVASSPSANSRYIWSKGELHLLPRNLSALLSSSFMRQHLGTFIGEWMRAKKEVQDESVWDFVSRRFSSEVAEYFFDPLFKGIFAGDIRKLSIRSCMPLLKEWEERYGSVTKGFFAHVWRKKKRQPKAGIASSFFSLEGGVETLIRVMQEKLQDKIVVSQEVKSVHFTNEGVVVKTQDKSWQGDMLFSALPCDQLGKLLQPIDQECAASLLSIPLQGLASVHLGYHADLLPVSGAGYLIPTCEKEDLLGVLFDSSIFPQNNRHKNETRLSAMLPLTEESDEAVIQRALNGLRRHLKIGKEPDFASVLRSKNAIPQYHVGHGVQIAALEERVKKRLPRLRLLGNYLHGVSVNECVRLAHLMTKG